MPRPWPERRSLCFLRPGISLCSCLRLSRYSNQALAGSLVGTLLQMKESDERREDGAFLRPYQTGAASASSPPVLDSAASKWLTDIQGAWAKPRSSPDIDESGIEMGEWPVDEE